ncbi:hypothetical protein [Microcoleus sp. S13_C3]|uniref:hypothetical protein n=1 Tax=Microcoleus sp. S13_C3 TaxID=3055409 RepID=UPI002FD05AE5
MTIKISTARLSRCQKSELPIGTKILIYLGRSTKQPGTGKNHLWRCQIPRSKPSFSYLLHP